MKAILRNRFGFTRELDIPVKQSCIRMAVSSKFPTQIWNPGDLMVGEAQVFKTVEFVFSSEVHTPGGGSILYYDEKPEVSVKPNSTEDIITLVASHKLARGYGADLENKMVLIGKNTAAGAQETPWQYLDRLLQLAKAQEVDMPTGDWSNIQYQNQSVTNDPFAAMQQQMAYQQQMQQMQNQPIYATSVYGYGQWSSVASPQQPAFTPAFDPIMAQAIEKIDKHPAKPKAEVPEPVEPKKRFMRPQKS